MLLLALIALCALSVSAKIRESDLENMQSLHTQLNALHHVEESVYGKLTEQLEAIASRRHSRVTRQLRCGKHLKKFVEENCGEHINRTVIGVDISAKCCNQPCDINFIKSSLCPGQITP